MASRSINNSGSVSSGGNSSYSDSISNSGSVGISGK